MKINEETRKKLGASFRFVDEMFAAVYTFDWFVLSSSAASRLLRISDT